jgi:hypothetical protein
MLRQYFEKVFGSTPPCAAEPGGRPSAAPIDTAAPVHVETATFALG